MPSMTSASLPYAGTRAAEMLREALVRYTSQHRGGLRALAATFDMKQATVLSHMATGRIGIPLDRVEQFAEVLEMNVEEFSLAVIEQREPAMLGLLSRLYGHVGNRAQSGELASLIDEMRSTVDLSSRQMEDIRDILRHRGTPARLVTGRASELISAIRSAQPNGLDDREWERLIARVKVFLDEAGS